MALIDLIEERVVKVPLLATTKAGVIEELVGILVEAGKVSDPAATLRVVLEREALASTGLEDGIAVPHGKTKAVTGLTLAIGVAPRGVDFQAFDGKPSTLFFLILAPPDQAGPHIEALAEIARLAKSRGFCRTLAASGSASELVSRFQD